LREILLVKIQILEILVEISRIFFVDFDCENCMENRNANFGNFLAAQKKSPEVFVQKSNFQLAETTHIVEILCRFAL
jgi:hypothetical protein